MFSFAIHSLSISSLKQLRMESRKPMCGITLRIEKCLREGSVFRLPPARKAPL